MPNNEIERVSCLLTTTQQHKTRPKRKKRKKKKKMKQKKAKKYLRTMIFFSQFWNKNKIIFEAYEE